MCWNTFRPELGKPRTAKEDIRVFKVCLKSEEGAAKSYFQSFPYRPGETYEDLSFQEYNTRFRSYGIHSYSTECTFAEIPGKQYGCCDGYKYAVFRPGAVPTANTFVMNEWYGWRSLDICDREWENVRLAECVIPEGSRYCVNDNGEYVSNRIRVERILTYDEWKERLER